MIPRAVRSFGIDSPVRDYWLTRCQGFDVKAGARVVGRVEEILCAADPTAAAALVIRSGRLRRRERVVPVGRVLSVVPAAGTLQMADVVPGPRRRDAIAPGGAAVARHAWALAWLAVRLAGRFIAWSAPRLGRLALTAVAAGRARWPLVVRAARALAGELRRWRMGSAWWPGRARP
jgi:hypothetical protein